MRIKFGHNPFLICEKCLSSKVSHFKIWIEDNNQLIKKDNIMLATCNKCSHDSIVFKSDLEKIKKDQFRTNRAVQNIGLTATFVLFLLLYSFSSSAQISNNNGIIVKPNTAHLVHYDSFIKDSIRIDDGILANGWINDYYESGVLQHNGLYSKGKLVCFTNYFSNGNTERKLEKINTYLKKMTIYYREGNLKNQYRIYESVDNKWFDYLPNGEIKSFNPKSKVIYSYDEIYKYHANGEIQYEFTIINKRNNLYKKIEYSIDGEKKCESNVVMDADSVTDLLQI